jgi:quinol monooxygenase YgiN
MTKVHLAFFVRLEAKPGKEEAAAQFLRDGAALSQAEDGTKVWYGLRLGPSTFAISDAFEDEAGRQAHLSGRVAAALMAKAPDLFVSPPNIESVDVVAAKITTGPVDRGFFLELEARPGKAAAAKAFLTQGRDLAENETPTRAWFGLQFGPSKFAIFDVFQDEAGRQAHLSGNVAAALMANAPEFFSNNLNIQPIDVLAAKMPR